MTTTHELGSGEWVDAARAYLQDAIPRLTGILDGVHFAHCEVFTDAPAHIANPGTNDAAWWIEIDGPRVTVGTGDRDDIARRVAIDWHAALPLAKAIQDPPAPGSGGRLPDELMTVFNGLHNHMARLTRWG